MKIVRYKEEMQQLSLAFKASDKSIGFVPTMGALHSGHLSLINIAKKNNDLVACSIFVNPTQFNNADDLKNYPKTLEADLEKLKKVGCDMVFVPSVEEMYDKNLEVEKFDFDGLDTVMEGKHRPKHFDGVATIVKKLFSAVLPSKAYFGEKDFQQLLIIKKLSEKVFPNIQIEACPIVREEDGLAMSSRNRLLNHEERKKATTIFKIAQKAKDYFKKNDANSTLSFIEKAFKDSALFDIDYLSITDAKDITLPVTSSEAKECRLFIAVFLGKVRLIDNFLLSK